MANYRFWKVASSLFLLSLSAVCSAQIGSLSDGACWYDSKEILKIASFNDKTVYIGTRSQIEAEVEGLLGHNQKIRELDLALHCGGYGASLVAKIATENGSYCVWTRFEKGKLVARSIGVVAEKAVEGQLCDGHKSGEFILGINGGANSKEFIAELQGPKWSGVIKEVVAVSDKVYKVVLMKDFENRESEIATQLEDNFAGKNLIRYIEFNEYHHPVGEFVTLK